MKYRHFAGVSVIAGALTGALLLSSQSVLGSSHSKAPKTPLEQGKAKTIQMCQACHVFPGATQAGTVGPAFVAMKARFPDRQRLRDIIDDPHKSIKPHTMMPPFGRNGLMNKEEIELVIDYLYTI